MVMTGGFTVVPVPVLTDNYVWLIHDQEGGETAAVDPSVGSPVIEAAEARGWTISQVLNTHWHPDHTGGNQAIHEVRADVERYRNRGRCAHLLCFVYDPEGRIGNPRGLESELCTTSEHFAVDVVVAPK